MKRFLLGVISIGWSFFAIAQSWSPVAPLPIGRHHPVTFSLDGKGYAVTGTLANSSYSKNFLEYDPITNTWTALPDFPGPARSFSIGAAYEGKGYLGFGVDDNFDYNDLWEYDPATGQWTQLASCPCQGRSHPAFIIANDHIFVGLGGSVSGDLKDWWLYSMATDSWSQLPDLPGPQRHHPYMFEADGNVYAGMGHGGFNIYNDWYMMDTATLTWTVMNNFPGEARVAGTQFSYQDYGYVLSGDGDNHSFMNTGEFWQYTPETDSWVELPAHPGISLWAPGSFIIDGEVYFFGGVNRQMGNFPIQVWKYDLTESPVGLDDQSLASISVYPNPVKNFLNVDGVESKLKLELYSITGHKVMEMNILEGNKKIDLSELAPGIYHLHLIDERNSRIERILVY